jgi:hypothetical protein
MARSGCDVSAAERAREAWTMIEVPGSYFEGGGGERIPRGRRCFSFAFNPQRLAMCGRHASAQAGFFSRRMLVCQRNNVLGVETEDNGGLQVSSSKRARTGYTIDGWELRLPMHVLECKTG